MTQPWPAFHLSWLPESSTSSPIGALESASAVGDIGGIRPPHEMPAPTRIGTQRMPDTKQWITGLTLSLVTIAAAAPADKIEQALREVREVKADLFSRRSSVLGRLPGPAELAAHQLRCRPLPEPTAGVPREVEFDAETTKRAAELDPVALRRTKGRMGMRILPLGITGAYVTEVLDHQELIVVHVLPDSPANGVLELDDIIMGVNGRLFADPEDPRPELGHALAESQSPELGGILTLQVVRARKPMNVKIDLGNTLAYSETWPFLCEKSSEMASPTAPATSPGRTVADSTACRWSRSPATSVISVAARPTAQPWRWPRTATRPCRC